MDALPELVAELAARPKTRLRLPEHRQIELYTRRKSLAVAEADARVAGMRPHRRRLHRLLAAAGRLRGGRSGAGRPQHLGRLSRAAARQHRRSGGRRNLPHPARRPQGGAAPRRARWPRPAGCSASSASIDGTVLALDISPAGLALLESVVAYYLGSFAQPYSAAYVEAMVLRYYADIVGEVKRFSDEGRSLFQFREPLRLNRHLRLRLRHRPHPHRGRYLPLSRSARRPAMRRAARSTSSW